MKDTSSSEKEESTDLFRTEADMNEALETIQVSSRGNEIDSLKVFAGGVGFRDSWANGGGGWKDTFVNGGQFISNFNNLHKARPSLRNPELDILLTDLNKVLRSSNESIT